mmetsp:Transcript_16778/g.31731  ORF Transcript_16778/g.31731 Transcript_16778/m.31731 type:complete len:162 (-) Transcript_16778:61-546(-)
MHFIFVLLLLHGLRCEVESARPAQEREPVGQADIKSEQQSTTSDPAVEADGIRRACQEAAADKGENVTVALIRTCVDELELYVQKTRAGLVASIGAEKEFVKQYLMAAKQIAKLGHVEDVWRVAEKDKDKALHVLARDADETIHLAQQLRNQSAPSSTAPS